MFEGLGAELSGGYAAHDRSSALGSFPSSLDCVAVAQIVKEVLIADQALEHDG
jgi:hypothetical protein